MFSKKDERTNVTQLELKNFCVYTPHSDLKWPRHPIYNIQFPVPGFVEQVEQINVEQKQKPVTKLR